MLSLVRKLILLLVPRQPCSVPPPFPEKRLQHNFRTGLEATIPLFQEDTLDLFFLLCSCCLRYVIVILETMSFALTSLCQHRDFFGLCLLQWAKTFELKSVELLYFNSEEPYWLVVCYLYRRLVYKSALVLKLLLSYKQKYLKNSLWHSS